MLSVGFSRGHFMIEVRDVVKSYDNGRTCALRGVSLDVADGGFTVLLGASGSGKSTLLSVMSGLETPDGGSVKYDGEDIAGLSEREKTAFRRRNVGFVFQQYYLLPHLSVDGNVKLGANLAHNKDYKDIIAAVGLSDKLKSKPAELSGGEQQRVCIARALAKDPRVLFLDEPTGALDEATGRSVLDVIYELRRERGFTVVMVTHNANIAETADDVVRLNSGKVVDRVHNSAPKSAYEIGW